MTITQTSLEAWEYLQREGVEVVLTQKQRIYQILANQGPCTDRELKTVLGWEINIITARRNALYKEGKVIAVGTKPNTTTRRKAMLWATHKQN